jgi:hypothetical protein
MLPRFWDLILKFNNLASSLEFCLLAGNLGHALARLWRSQSYPAENLISTRAAKRAAKRERSGHSSANRLELQHCVFQRSQRHSITPAARRNLTFKTRDLMGRLPRSCINDPHSNRQIPAKRTPRNPLFLVPNGSSCVGNPSATARDSRKLSHLDTCLEPRSNQPVAGVTGFDSGTSSPIRIRNPLWAQYSRSRCALLEVWSYYYRFFQWHSRAFRLALPARQCPRADPS